MSVWVVIIAFVPMVVVIVLLVLLTQRMGRQRTEQMAALARTLGLGFTPAASPVRAASHDRNRYATPADQAFLRMLEGCPLLQNCTRRRVRHILQGVRGEEQWLICDFACWQRVRAWAESEAVEGTLVARVLPESQGRLSIQPRLPLIGRLQAADPGEPTVDTGDQAFDARFIVRSRDPAAVRRLLTPPAREYLVGLYDDPRKWYRHLYAHDHHLLLWEATLAPPEHVRDMMIILQELQRRRPVREVVKHKAPAVL